MELDHIFICANRGVLEAEVLKAFGPTEDSAYRHPGQGTANRRFFFCNAFIELLYLDDPAETRNETTKPTRLYERLAADDDTVSPFGICFRPASKAETRPPFSSWSYKRKEFLLTAICQTAATGEKTQNSWTRPKPDRLLVSI